MIQPRGGVRLRFLLALSVLFVASASSALAQKPAPLKDPRDAKGAQERVDWFLQMSSAGKLPTDDVESFATDQFASELKGRLVIPPWFLDTRYTVAPPFTVSKDERIVIVNATTTGDSIPWVGPLKIDWTFFLKKSDKGEWRISSVRRLNGIEKGVETLRFLDTASNYPSTLKPLIARETSLMLRTNSDLRAHFEGKREAFQKLLGHFQRRDSLKILGRVGRHVSQLNRAAIDWGIAGQDVPQETIDEYMAMAGPEERTYLQQQLRVAERLRKSGRDTLTHLAKRMKLKLPRLDSAIALMQDVDVSFINTLLPWKGAAQFTVAGILGDAVGYLYSPHEIPWISPEEYFYLEDLGNGWWIFRST